LPVNSTPFTLDGGSIKINVRLTPKSSANRILGIKPDANGDMFLRAAVTAVPENGKANKALIKMLAKIWRLPKTRFVVLSGGHDRNKVLSIEGGDNELYNSLVRWAGTL